MTTQNQFFTSARKSVALAFFLIANGFAQVLSPLPSPTPSAGDPIMGFETPKGWAVKSNSASTTVAAATVRTQGSFSFALGSPSNPTTLASSPVASTATALTGVGDAGAVFAVDVLPPAGSTGSLRLSVNSPSRHLTNELVGEVDLTGLHPGIYNTMKFPIPDAVRTALGGATFKDLSFGFALSSPPSGDAPKFLFDNLRVISNPLIPAALGVTAPPNFGGSVDLVAVGDTPATQSFTIGVVQVPDSLRLVQGTAGSTTATLGLGNDGSSTFTCTYTADPSDQTDQTYHVVSCTGGAEAGDLVGANFAELTITGGTPSMTIQAQLAKNPIGDLVGSGAIPPLPTFWGHSDTCVPAPVAGKVVATTDSCTSQAAEASQIVTDYFNKVTASQAPPNWIVTPPADAALRHGTGLPDSIVTFTPNQNSNFPFDQEGHVNKGGSYDAYWILNGDLNVSDTASTGSSTSHFDATFGAHVVLNGDDVNVISVNATADTTNGTSPSAKGSANVYLFGVELPGGGSVDASTGFNLNLSDSQDFNVGDFPIWIFTVEIDATASASIDTTGTLAATGFSLKVDPKVSMGMHVFGGVDVGVASGGVDVKLNLLDVEAPVTAQAGLDMNLSGDVCDLTLSYSLNGDLTISSLGGEVDLVGTLGVCPFCVSGSYTLLKWAPILKTTEQLFSVGPNTLGSIPLPSTMCGPKTIAPPPVPPVGITVSSVEGLTGVPLAGIGKPQERRQS